MKFLSEKKPSEIKEGSPAQKATIQIIVRKFKGKPLQWIKDYCMTLNDGKDRFGDEIYNLCLDLFMVTYDQVAKVCYSRMKIFMGVKKD